jgi:hypothetical protein
MGRPWVLVGGCGTRVVAIHNEQAMSFDDPDTTTFNVICPYCGEEVQVYLEPDVQGSLVIDCEVCCQPWHVHVTRDRDYRYLDVSRGDGSE